MLKNNCYEGDAWGTHHHASKQAPEKKWTSTSDAHHITTRGQEEEAALYPKREIPSVLYSIEPIVVHPLEALPLVSEQGNRVTECLVVDRVAGCRASWGSHTGQVATGRLNPKSSADLSIALQSDHR